MNRSANMTLNSDAKNAAHFWRRLASRSPFASLNRNNTLCRNNPNILTSLFDEGYTVDMKTTIDKIIEEVLSLSPQARAFVAEKLIESLDTEPAVTLSSAWRDEIRKRYREIDEGTVELRDAEEVFARAYAALG